MRTKRRHGATLSLLVASTFVVVLVGIAVFFVVKMLGGAHELQNAVDSGNLQVAKSVLKNPNVTPTDPGLNSATQSILNNNFSTLVDSNGTFDLLVFNRLIAQAMIVGINASADYNLQSASNPTQGVLNAQQLIAALADPNSSLGALLTKRLQTSGTLDQSFFGLSSVFPTRMLNNSTQAIGLGPNDAVGLLKDSSYMARGLASNVYFANLSLPPGFSSNSFITNYEVQAHKQSGQLATDQGGQPLEFLQGYSVLNIPNVSQNTLPLVAVPLRPLQNPHLVAVSDFTTNKSAINGVQPSSMPAIPPNAFKSFGQVTQLTQSTLQTLSCAVAGTSAAAADNNGYYGAKIPCGYIVVANGNSTGSLATPLTASVSPNAFDAYASGFTDNVLNGAPTNDLFSDILMSGPIYVAPNGAMSTNQGDLTKIENYRSTNPTGPVPLGALGISSNFGGVVNGVNNPQSAANGIGANDAITACTSGNTAPGDPNANPLCVNNMPNMEIVYNTNGPGGGGFTPVRGLMALEYEKAQIIDPRPSGGPANSALANFPGGGVCTGIKDFNFYNGSSTSPANGSLNGMTPANFGKPPTVLSVLNDFAADSKTSQNASSILAEITNRMYEMRPTSTPQDITNALTNAALPMGKLVYIYVDPNSNSFYAGLNQPSWVAGNSTLTNFNPDGGSIVADTGMYNADGVYVNLDGEMNYPHPWDCESTSMTENKAVWTRSSGYNCMLGVLRMMNCTTDGGGSWRCPC
jgi:hypothetical protein